MIILKNNDQIYLSINKVWIMEDKMQKSLQCSVNNLAGYGVSLPLM